MTIITFNRVIIDFMLMGFDLPSIQTPVDRDNWIPDKLQQV